MTRAEPVGTGPPPPPPPPAAAPASAGAGLLAPLHPGAWWLWALALATTASRTTNPLLLAEVVVVAGCVVAARKADTPWARAYVVFLKLGLIVIAIRVVFHILFGGTYGTTVLVRLPEVPLPGWAQGIRLGGPVTAEGLVAALYDGFRLAVLLGCVGAANALANPKRLLRSLPAALYEVSVAVVVALTTTVHLVASFGHIRRARQLRGDSARGLRTIRTVLVPVLHNALDRALALAAAMDSRGYGRAGRVSTATRRVTAGLLLLGLLGMCVGGYGLLDGGSPMLIGLPTMAAGMAAAVAGLVLAARRVPRTRYQPDRWRAREAAVVLSGVAAVAGLLAVEAGGSSELLWPSTMPLTAPQLPLLAAAGVLLAIAPAWVAPAPNGGRS